MCWFWPAGSPPAPPPTHIGCSVLCPAVPCACVLPGPRGVLKSPCLSFLSVVGKQQDGAMESSQTKGNGLSALRMGGRGCQTGLGGPPASAAGAGPGGQVSGASGRSADPTRSAQRWPVSLHPGEVSDAPEGGLTQVLVGPVGSQLNGLSAEALRPAAISDEADRVQRLLAVGRALGTGG